MKYSAIDLHWNNCHSCTSRPSRERRWPSWFFQTTAAARIIRRVDCGRHYVRHMNTYTVPYPLVRSIQHDDYPQWRPLWDGYNAFYGRSESTALDEHVTAQTWERFFDVTASMQAFVAELDGRIVGIAHLLFHRSTSRLADVCYLQDLFTEEACRGRGVGRSLIQRVLDTAEEAGSSRVYWTTQTTNVAGRALYDKMAEHRGFIVYSHEV